MGTWEVCSCEHKERENWSRRNANAHNPHGIYPLLQNSDRYKFLGKQENATHLEEIVMREGSKEYLCRCAVIWSSPLTIPRNNKKRSHTQLDSRKQVIAFQDRVITINIKEAQHPLK